MDKSVRVGARLTRDWKRWRRELTDASSVAALLHYSSFFTPDTRGIALSCLIRVADTTRANWPRVQFAKHVCPPPYHGMALSGYYGGTIVNRTYGTYKNLYISLFLLTIFGPIYYRPP